MDDGFGVGEVLVVAGIALHGGGEEVASELRVGIDVIVAGGLLAVKEEEAPLLHMLVEAVVVVQSPGAVGRGAEEVDAVGHVGRSSTHEAEDGGHDIGLLRHGRADAARQAAGGVEDDDGDAEGAEVVGVGGVFGGVGVVGGDDEDGVVVPGLLGGCGEEAAEGHVGVADAGVHGVAWLVEGLCVAFWHYEGVVGCGGEEGGHEGFFDGTHGEGVVLEEFFVPDGPGAVEVFFAAEAGVGVIFFSAIVMGEAGGASECFEAHGSVFGAVEEGGAVATAGKLCGDAINVVEGVARHEEGFDEHGYAGEHGGHAVDALATVGVAVTEGEALRDERVEEGGVAL